MNERPILFSTPMVQSILEGRKTMTRRIINPKPDHFHKFNDSGLIPQNGDKDIKCPYGQTGDLLWVREGYSIAGFYNTQLCFYYKADEGTMWAEMGDNFPERISFFKPKPSIHMPKQGARIWLQVEEIRVERLQDISEKDTIAEGVKYDFHEGENYFYVYPPKDETKGIYIGPCLVSGTYVSVSSAFGGDTPWKFSFKSLINKIHGEGAWEKNPWVWVVKYKVLSTTGKPSLP